MYIFRCFSALKLSIRKKIEFDYIFTLRIALKTPYESLEGYNGPYHKKYKLMCIFSCFCYFGALKLYMTKKYEFEYLFTVRIALKAPYEHSEGQNVPYHKN